MNREDALRFLTSTNARERLEAARFLERAAIPEDSEQLRKARHAESVIWIRDALTRALNLTTAGGSDYREPTTPTPGTVEEELDSAYAAAMRDVADQLVHELDPLVGAARLHAAEELANEPASKTRRDIERIASVLSAVDDLARASSAAVIQDFNLADVVAETVAAVPADETIAIQLAGDDPYPVRGDPVLTHIAVRNGLANAVEATRDVDPSRREPIVISWGRSGTDYRVSILDRAHGLPDEFEVLVDLGVTTKADGHSGLGLMLARRAALSLHGQLGLRNVEPRGALFELRWPRDL